MVEIVTVEEAVGRPLAHDITEIVPGKYKRAAFRRGHVVRARDVAVLRGLGKDHLYILKPEFHQMHEDDAARAIADALCGPGVGWTDPPREGRISLKASLDGLLKVDVDSLAAFNELGEVMCATMHTNSVVTNGDRVAATRAIPLLIDSSVVEQAVRIAGSAGGVLRVTPFRQARAGVIITGNELYYGRIEDKFEPVIRKKIEALKGTVLDVVFLPDDDEKIVSAVLDLRARGADVLITTGGMSVDPDDRTRFAMQKAGAENIIYGSAVIPGAMFMLASLGGVPVLGIPSCGLFAAATVFDLIYPRVLAGETMTRKDVARLGHGGLCLKCDPCHFPKCPFGKSF